MNGQFEMPKCKHNSLLDGATHITVTAPLVLPQCQACQIEKLTAERDEARTVARQAVAAVNAYAEELNGEKTEHVFDDVIATWPNEMENPMVNKRTEEIKAALDKAYHGIAPDLVRSVATSMASFIAEIDSDSSRVADYLERRLAPLIPLARTDFFVQRALEQIARDDRKG